MKLRARWPMRALGWARRRCRSASPRRLSPGMRWVPVMARPRCLQQATALVMVLWQLAQAQAQAQAKRQEPVWEPVRERAQARARRRLGVPKFGWPR